MNRFPRIASLRLLFLLFLVMALLAGCSTHNLRVAQDKFEEGSMQEWIIRTDPAQSTGAASLLPATRPYTISYREALVLVDKNLAEHKDSLIQDNLYCTALVLKALCLWKLDESEELDAVINYSGKMQSAFLTEQWQLLLLSEKFLDADRAVASIRKYDGQHDIPLEVYASAIKKLSDADSQIVEALKKPDIKNNLPLKRYLIFTRITIHKNYINACDYVANKTDDQLSFLGKVENELNGLEAAFKKLSANKIKKL